MPIINRLSRLFRADLHAVLDRIEEPELLLRQSIREMEEALQGTRQECERRGRELTRQEAQLAELSRRLEALDEQLDVCFESANDDLARRTIRRQLEARRQCELLAVRRDEAKRTLDTLRARLEQEQAQLDSMRDASQCYCEDDGRAGSERPLASSDNSIRDEDVEVAFLREQRIRSAS